MGWSLGGLSVVTRCPTTIAQDGFIDGVDFDANDRFCLDGQRLMVVSGAYGGNGAEYRTEIESFSKIVSYGSQGGGPAYFKVWTKSGQMLEYGVTADSRIEAQGRSDVLTWAVNKISDTTNNYIQFNYFEDEASGYYTVLSIDYTGNGTTGAIPFARVVFVYDSRPDNDMGYINGSKVYYVANRINTVRTLVYGNKVREYRLAYENGTATNRTRLIRLAECDAQNICKPATTFTWQEKASGFNGTISSSICSNANCDSDNKPFNSYPDINGDGKTDLCYRSDTGVVCYLATGSGWGTQINTGICGNATCDADNKPYINYPDLNADGKSDLCYRDDTGVNCYLSTGSGFGAPISSNICANAGTYGCDSDNKPYISYPDVNGDTRPDLCYRADTGVRCFLGTGSGWGAKIETNICANAGTYGCDLDNKPTVRYPDINGDGLADIAYRSDLGIRVFISTGTSFNLMATYDICSNSECNSDNYPYIAYPDINGDGNSDICYRADTGVKCYLGTGVGFKGPISTDICSNSTCDSDNKPTIQYVDINSDGKRDIVYRSDEGVRGYLSNGLGFDPVFTTSICSNAECNSDNVFTIRYPDVNGDGLMDISVRSDSGIYVVKNNGLFPDLLVGIKDGLNNQITINHKPLTDDALYTKYNNASFPERDLQVPMYVVESFVTDNGIGGTNTVRYQYEGLKQHTQGRGLLGFRKVIMTNETTGIVTSTTYNQTFPSTGTVAISETRLANNTLIGTVSNVWNTINNGNGTYTVQLNTNNKFNYELNGTLTNHVTTTNTYSAFGNAATITVDSNDGYVKTTTNTYSNDTANWYLGRLTSATVTSVTPLNGTQTRTTAFEYDTATGLLTAEIIEPNDANFMLRTAYTYDSYGNKTSATVSGNASAADPIAARTTSTAVNYAYLAVDGTYSVTTTNALNHSETKIVDARFGVVKSLTGPNGLTTTWSYDSFGRKSGEYRTDGTSTTLYYAWCSTSCPVTAMYKEVSATSGSAPVKTYFDRLGREVVKETVGLNGEIIYKNTEYDNQGRAYRASNPTLAGNTVYWANKSYDVLSRIRFLTNPDGSQTEIIYNGLTTTTINDKAQQSVQIKNSQGQVVRSMGADNKNNQYQYDPFGNLLQVTDVAGNVSTMRYNIRGNKISMSDPDMGAWQYRYNALGQLVWQRDAKRQDTSMSYDKLGRMISRTEPEGSSSWNYDIAANGIGKLAQVTASSGFERTYTYDVLGRPQDIIATIDSENLAVTTNYDGFSRVSAITYPSGFSTKNIYNTYGYRTEIRNAANDSLYWQAQAANAAGQITDERLGNGLNTIRTFNPLTGLLEGISTGNGGNVQLVAYQYDTLGNLTQRQDMNQSLTETFGYDNFNRLINSSVTGGPSLSIQYDAIGNITYKSDVGNYSYGADVGSNTAGPHAVTTAGGIIYTYNLNGNQVAGDGRTLSYTSYNKISSVYKNVDAMSIFTYDADRNRVKKTYFKNSVLESTTYYLGKIYEKVVKTSGVTEHKHYISTGNTTIVYTTRSNNTEDTRYLHKDQLGSTDVITDETAQVVERTSFNAWGARRNATGWSVATSPITSLITNRGYTGHEQEDDFGLVNMNARMYDAKLGRFLQADTFIQFPYSTQGLSRYTYVNNNPLSFTDPSGNFLFTLGALYFGASSTSVFVAAVAADFVAAKNSSTYRQVSSIAAAATGVPWITAATASLNTWGAGGSGGDILRSAAIAYGTTAAFDAIGDAELPGPAAVAAHGVVGGIRSELQGGRFETGFMSQAFSKFVTINTSDLGNIEGGIVAVVAGGTSSVLGGGKFANGAVTSAFGYMFNQLSSNARRKARRQAAAAAERRRRREEIKAQFDPGLEDIVRGIFPGGTAGLVRDPLGGNIDSQVKFANTVNWLRDAAVGTQTALYVDVIAAPVIVELGSVAYTYGSILLLSNPVLTTEVTVGVASAFEGVSPSAGNIFESIGSSIGLTPFAIPSR